MSRFRRLASIDIGTNSTRLLVADCDGRRTDTLERRMVITRLGQGVDETRSLAPSAVKRTGSALETYRGIMDGLEPEALAAVATSAVRDAANGERFLDAAERILGSRPIMLSGEEEARMSFIGAASDLDPGRCGEGSMLVFDIGGGSTELIAGSAQDRTVLKAASVNVGCVRMSERFLSVDPPSPLAVGRMESYIISQLKPVVDTMVAGGRCCAVGLAGTVTTIAGIRLSLREYDTDRIHHSVLTRAGVEDIFSKLASVPVEERKKVMGFEPGRADVIVGGAAVLRAIMDLAHLDEILVSEKDILDGLVLDLHSRME